MDIRIKEVLNNLKNYDFDVLGNYKMDEREAKKLIEAIEEQEQQAQEHKQAIINDLNNIHDQLNDDTEYFDILYHLDRLTGATGPGAV